MTDQLEKLVAETPQENVRSPKPKIEDFTDYGEDGKKVVNVAGYQAVSYTHLRAHET